MESTRHKWGSSAAAEKKEKRRRKTKISRSREGGLRGECRGEYRGECVDGRGERGERRGIRGEKYLTSNKLITFCQIVDQNKKM